MESLDSNKNKTEKIETNIENIPKTNTTVIDESADDQILRITSEIKKEDNIITETTKEVYMVRQELQLEGEEKNIPSIEPNKNKKSKLEKVLSLLQSNISSFSKVAAMSAGLFAVGNNLEASNIGQNKNDKVIQGLENVSSI
jgi:hypothetical protein